MRIDLLKIALYLNLLVSYFAVYGQKSSEDLVIKHNFYLQYDLPEAFSINYERRVLNTEIVMLHFNVGFSHTQANYNSLGYRGFGFPVGLTSVFGKKTSHFETGIGFWGQKSYNHKQKSSNNSEYRLQFKIGYRFQKLHRNRINFRIGYAPAYMFEWDDDYLSTDTGGTLYINLGYSFK